MLYQKSGLIFCLFFAASAASQDFYVSPLGNDQANGSVTQPAQNSANGPLLTLSRAQQLIRDLKKNGLFKEPITVHLQPGAYTLNKPLEFDQRDSGTVGREINWQADTGTAMISGGIALKDCKPRDNKIWSCPADNLALDTIKYVQTTRKQGNTPGFELFVNQKPMHLARWPNTDWAHIKQPLDEKTRFSSLESLPTSLQNGPATQVHIFAGNDWFDQYIAVSAIDRDKNEISLSSPTSYPIAIGYRYYLQNLPSELDAPGEWIYDPTEQKILFIPPDNAVPKDIVVSALPKLIAISNADYIGFTNLALSYSTGTAINIDKANHISMDNLEVNNVGGNAIEAKNSSNISVSNSRIHDSGEGGIMLAGGNRNTLEPANNLIQNNHIFNVSRIILTYTPGISLEGVGGHAAHNLVEHSGGAAVQIGGNDHLFERNEVRHACEQASDCGAIYMGRDWTNHGNLIRHNSIHDIPGYTLKNVDIAKNTVIYGEGGARGVYLDDAVSGFSIIGNLLYKISSMSIQLGGGRDNTIENNLILTGDYGIWVDNREPDFNWDNLRKRLTQVPYQSTVWRNKYPKLSQPMSHEKWPEGNSLQRNIIISSRTNGPTLRYTLPRESNKLANNLVWSSNGPFSVDYDILDGLARRGGAPWQDWINEGIEQNSIYADPCVKVTGNQVTFCAQSPIEQIGFQDLPLDIGLKQ